MIFVSILVLVLPERLGEPRFIVQIKWKQQILYLGKQKFLGHFRKKKKIIWLPRCYIQEIILRNQYCNCFSGLTNVFWNPSIFSVVLNYFRWPLYSARDTLYWLYNLLLPYCHTYCRPNTFGIYHSQCCK